MNVLLQAVNHEDARECFVIMNTNILSDNMDLLLPMLISSYLRNNTKLTYVFVAVPSDGGAQRLMQVLAAMIILHNGLNVRRMMS